VQEGVLVEQGAHDLEVSFESLPGCRSTFPSFFLRSSRRSFFRELICIFFLFSVSAERYAPLPLFLPSKSNQNSLTRPSPGRFTTTTTVKCSFGSLEFDWMGSTSASATVRIPPSFEFDPRATNFQHRDRSTTALLARSSASLTFVSPCSPDLRAGESENGWIDTTHLITYHRLLRFFADGTVISLLSTEQ